MDPPFLQLHCVPLTTGYEYVAALCIPTKPEVAFLPTPNAHPWVSSLNFEPQSSLPEESSLTIQSSDVVEI